MTTLEMFDRFVMCNNVNALHSSGLFGYKMLFKRDFYIKNLTLDSGAFMSLFII